ncbi:cation-translocating P-type ATPase [Sideroxydans lithotrophicus]|uniref:P-type Cu(+) transporter n=1 Tax=Sideroxydans lithotrophicus (strain ES-1) TaxID=580332 RepID=D5CRJ1_SIDLE|nr:cation-translocating P-type ATPase [Sideroxydans lithotrophicus]ADE11577.1 ATPase, P-type (transporting), HAD superfamily, subfamily IC [Sideroxydans lithotrophicus ES-1]
MTTTFPSGLSHEAASARLAAEGANELGTDQRRTLPTIAGEVAREPMFLLLLGAGAIYLAMGDAHEALILLGFVVIIMAVTILQERRTEKALEALRDLSSPRALVIRDGVPKRIAGCEVVRDDILILVEGDRVPADGIVLQAHELAADESMLTGESVAVEKFPERGEVFAGTLIVRGQGLMRVTAIGSRTELGSIGKSLQDIVAESSPLRDEIALLTRHLALIGIGLCLALAALFWILRGGWLDALLAGITLAMGILPQEFPVIMIVFLALGARRIANQRVLTRRLNAIETLGETTVLCVDKTGTLTQNRMAVTSLSVGGQFLETADISGCELPETYHELLEYAVLASEIDPHDPMELAFHGFAREYLANTEHLHPDWSLAREYEISSELLAMSHLWRNDSGKQDIVATKGAPEAIADLCHLPEDARLRMSRDAESMADRGLRVLGVAKAKHSIHETWPDIQHEFEFEFVGLAGLADPLRPEVSGAVAECHRAGIRVVMITGDHPRTARAIAASAGIDGSTLLTGDELANMDAGALAQRISSVNVFARVTPQQKLAIVEALKANGDIVAMTGDGVNDAPALKAAHIGIAMGKRGTDVAREAASLVLLEDDFTAIVAAIRLGRRIFANLRQAVVYTLAVHVPIIGLSIIPLFFGLPLVLAPIHIAFLELIIDPACSIVFEAEAGSRSLMQQPPRPHTEHLIATPHLLGGLAQGVMATLSIAIFYMLSLRAGIVAEEARALAFIVLVTANAALILSVRSTHRNWQQMFTAPSTVALWVLAGTLSGLALITGVPSIAQAFAFQPPTLQHWLAAFASGIGTVLLLDAGKIGLRALGRSG